MFFLNGWMDVFFHIVSNSHQDFMKIPLGGLLKWTFSSFIAPYS